MNDSSFRKTFAELFGRQVDKEALIMDTRWNGGGWLHDDLAKLLSGTDYSWAVPRGKQVGKEPQNRWTKPVVLVMGEANYSDAHFFPYAYTALNIGKTVGMPIPGTATAVWWENLLDPSLVFGMPMVGVKNTDGEFLENNQLEPDYRVKNDPESIAKGRDKQIEKAVEVLLEQLD
jgi:C-terminal processing protease CtpA/Prc